MTPDEWLAAADNALRLLSAPWEFGDWCVAADRLGLADELADILRSDPRFEGTELGHYAFVSTRFPPHRRRPLPWTYHDAVARLPPDIADELLDLAASEQWTLQEVRRASRETAKGITR